MRMKAGMLPFRDGGAAALPYSILAGMLLFGVRVASAQPANDACAGAIALTNAVPYALSTSAATSTGDPVPACGPLANGVWFTFVPALAGSVTVSCCGSSFDTVLAVYSGSCGSLASVGCNDDGCGTQSTLQFTGTAG